MIEHLNLWFKFLIPLWQCWPLLCCASTHVHFLQTSLTLSRWTLCILWADRCFLRFCFSSELATLANLAHAHHFPSIHNRKCTKTLNEAGNIRLHAENEIGTRKITQVKRFVKRFRSSEKDIELENAPDTEWWLHVLLFRFYDQTV